jgi:hypothetical protein
VMCAGQVAVRKGVIVGMTNRSGHYETPMWALMNCVRYLKLLKLKIAADAVCQFDVCNF